MVRIEATYDGNLRCTATHMPSGSKLITDAPVDNKGKGESFSPTDLLATSMLTCIMTIVAIRAESRQIDVSGMSGSIEKTMAANPRRVAKLEVIVNLPSDMELDDRAWLITEGCNCPVCVSVSESMDVDVTFQ
ncbi:MAG: OsmC family protein [Candidatus Poseidoniaceae archaeon]|jgi:putative redox protein|nr:OsmC family protein [Candidatus Poseidoniaceae archaeon]|tara:strand:+ start:1361 stop:1759 length:399 start_codon:yes stop_codon:yes gene_type:complete